MKPRPFLTRFDVPPGDGLLEAIRPWLDAGAFLAGLFNGLREVLAPDFLGELLTSSFGGLMLRLLLRLLFGPRLGVGLTLL